MIEAFRVLDTDKKGFVDLHTLENILRNFKDTYNKLQIKEFEDFINDNQNDFFEKTPSKDSELSGEKSKVLKSKRFYYESYVRKVLGDNKKHWDSLMEEYYLYYNQYLSIKGIK